MRWYLGRGYRRLSGSEEKVDKDNPNGNASLCVRCGKCLEKCPQGIAIPDELEKAHAILAKREPIAAHFGEN
jgi:predicted aldo/keto reductase-like oxidoreductase